MASDNCIITGDTYCRAGGTSIKAGDTRIVAGDTCSVAGGSDTCARMPLPVQPIELIYV